MLDLGMIRFAFQGFSYVISNKTGKFETFLDGKPVPQERFLEKTPLTASQRKASGNRRCCSDYTFKEFFVLKRWSTFQK